MENSKESIEKKPRHRPHREYPEAQRVILAPEVENCPMCGQPLNSLRNWHSRKTIQTLNGPLFVAGRSKECQNPGCAKRGMRYYASRVWLYSLPQSSYGLDVLAFIGWQHEHEHRQLVEIQRELNQRGIEVNERNVGKLYRQFLALLSASAEQFKAKLTPTVQEYGGVIWAVDALQPEGNGLLYVLYEVLSNQPVAALQGEQINEQELVAWLKPYQSLELPVLATLSDGENTLIAALKICWSQAPHQRCQVHFLNNLVADLQEWDDELRTRMRQDLGGVPKVPKHTPQGPAFPPQ
jgi:Transposase, Mutator family